MNEPCEMMPWDTEFFGFRIAGVRGNVLNEQSARNADAWCREHQVRCLYCNLRGGDFDGVKVAESNHYELVDAKTTLERRIESHAGRNNPTIRTAIEHDADALESIATASHRGGRFDRDIRFGKGKAAEMFRVWIRNALSDANDHVIVAEMDRRVVGYSICRMRESEATISLLAVDDSARKRGLGAALVEQSLAVFASNDRTLATVVTQIGNIPAQRLYQRCGFATRSTTLVYHKWFDPGANRV